MCNPDSKAYEQQCKIGNRAVEDSFSWETISRQHPSTIRPSHCLQCGTYLTESQMRPPGRMARYMCYSCYLQAINVTKTNPHVCLECGRPLPDHQVRKRMREPRELKHAFCKGQCVDYHFVKAGIVLGHRYNLRSGQVHNSYPARAEYPALDAPHHVQPGITHNDYTHVYSLPYDEQTNALKQEALGLANQLRGQFFKPISLPESANRSVQSGFVDVEYSEIETDTRSRKWKIPRFLPLGRKR